MYSLQTICFIQHVITGTKDCLTQSTTRMKLPLSVFYTQISVLVHTDVVRDLNIFKVF